MAVKVVSRESDLFGAIVSGLCLIHCLATPFLFIIKSCSIQASCCSATPLWWQYFDIAFLFLSGFAVYWSAKFTSKKWMRTALWVTWLALTFIIANELKNWFVLPEFLIYIPTLSLVSLHIYNRKYCRCQQTTCCSSKE